MTTSSLRRDISRATRTWAIIAVAAGACLVSAAATAQVVRVEITTREPMAGGQPQGPAGPYELLRGRVHGEVDPRDARNAIIQDLALAPVNSRGRVAYVATFALAKPVDMRLASGVLIYTVVNRGNGTAQAGPDGHVSLVSGWQGDVASNAGNYTIQVPTARRADGSPVTGSVIARFWNLPAGANTATIRLSSMGSGPPAYVPAALDDSTASLMSAGAEDAQGRKTDVRPVSRGDWAFADCRNAPFPGVPNPTTICVKGGFDAARLYELTYTAKDPLVLGIGLAATRDIVSFFRHAPRDETGLSNPVAGAIRHAIAVGDSQSGNLIKTFIHLGFNQDLNDRRVWEGVFPRIAARQTPINFRFALPGGAATLYEPGSEPALWWSRYTDTTRGRAPASLLDRCRATNTCPRVIEAFGSAEFWGLRMSPGLVGTDARGDIALPDNVRRYYYPGTTHGGGRGGFQSAAGAVQSVCVLPANPNPQSDTTRALTRALVDWVVRDIPPPASRYPLLGRGELAPATQAGIRFPTVPGLPQIDGLVNPMLDYEFGAAFVANDLSGVLGMQPPRIRQVIPTLVPTVDADGNETSGVPSVLHQNPLGTYLGWNVTAAGFFKGQGCGFAGGYWPFARTRTERLAVGDPRPSLEERYGTLEGYACSVRRAAERAVADRFLLRDDADRLIAEAGASRVLPSAENSGADARRLGDQICGAPR